MKQLMDLYRNNPQQDIQDEIVNKLISFEQDIIHEFEAGWIKAPVHLSGGNEIPLIDIFKSIRPDDWVFSTWRSHYHALLHGIDPDWLKREIMDGKSITINNAEHRFFTSAIVGGTLPIAVGVAEALKRKGTTQMVWCFIGDMAAMSGIFHEAQQWAQFQDLPIRFVIEDNNFSTNTPTSYAWYKTEDCNDKYWSFKIVTKHKVVYYKYARRLPHQGSGKFILF